MDQRWPVEESKEEDERNQGGRRRLAEGEREREQLATQSSWNMFRVEPGLVQYRDFIWITRSTLSSSKSYEWLRVSMSQKHGRTQYCLIIWIRLQQGDNIDIPLHISYGSSP